MDNICMVREKKMAATERGYFATAIMFENC